MSSNQPWPAQTQAYAYGKHWEHKFNVESTKEKLSDEEIKSYQDLLNGNDRGKYYSHEDAKEALAENRVNWEEESNFKELGFRTEKDELDTKTADEWRVQGDSFKEKVENLTGRSELELSSAYQGIDRVLKEERFERIKSEFPNDVAKAYQDKINQQKAQSGQSAKFITLDDAKNQLASWKAEGKSQSDLITDDEINHYQEKQNPSITVKDEDGVIHARFKTGDDLVDHVKSQALSHQSDSEFKTFEEATQWYNNVSDRVGTQMIEDTETGERQFQVTKEYLLTDSNYIVQDSTSYELNDEGTAQFIADMNEEKRFRDEVDNVMSHLSSDQIQKFHDDANNEIHRLFDEFGVGDKASDHQLLTFEEAHRVMAMKEVMASHEKSTDEMGPTGDAEHLSRQHSLEDEGVDVDIYFQPSEVTTQKY